MNIKQILQKHAFRFNKQFGQNFLTDDLLLSEIVQKAKISKNDLVLEIGAGAGTLTRQLAAQAKKVIAFEIDKNLMPILDETVGDLQNVEVVFLDILKMTEAEIENLTKGQPFKIVANIPYYITSPLVMKFVEGSLQVQSMVLTIQKEVALRLSAKHNTSDYGAITVAVQAVADVEVLLQIPREQFFPVPNVDSAVVSIDFNRSKFEILDSALFRKTVKVAFSMRRKTLANNLTQGFGISKEKAENLLTQLGVEKAIRGEALSVEQFVKLSTLL